MLSRTLGDEYKKSQDLQVYLLGIFYSLSNYSQFHGFLIQVGE